MLAVNPSSRYSVLQDKRCQTSVDHGTCRARTMSLRTFFKCVYTLSKDTVTKVKLKAGNIVLAPIAVAQNLAENIVAVYTVQRVRHSCYGLVRRPIRAESWNSAEDFMLYWTIKDAQLAGQRVIIVQRGYDGITNPHALKMWAAQWHKYDNLDLRIQTWLSCQVSFSASLAVFPESGFDRVKPFLA